MLGLRQRFGMLMLASLLCVLPTNASGDAVSTDPTKASKNDSSTVQTSTTQQPPFQDQLRERLIGNWVLTGTVAGQPTTHDVKAEWVLNHQYVQINEISRELNEKGQPKYEATVFVAWNAKTEQYACLWLDIIGGLSQASIGYATPSKDTMAFLFKGLDAGDDFHNTFKYNAKADTWEWLMDSEKKGILTPFGQLKLEKKPR
jgi:hypothetical protein